MEIFEGYKLKEIKKQGAEYTLGALVYGKVINYE